MAVYKKNKKLSPTERAYIAALIDGEGTISLSRKHRNENRQLVISISSTEKELLSYVLQVVGTGRITNKRTYSDNHSSSYTYIITNRQAYDLLQQIAPYLKSYKAKRAELVLSHYIRLTPRNGKYTNDLLKAREAFIQQFLALKPTPI